MKSRPDPNLQAYQRLLASHGGAPATAFVNLAGACVRRWLRQTARPVPAEAILARYLGNIWAVAVEAGLPEPLSAGERGEPGEMAGSRVADLTENVYAGLELGSHQDDLETITRQLLKACLQPEFRNCRASYKEVVKGVCRRQERVCVQERVSGSHCVDCPYWVTLRPEQHLALLTAEWVAADRQEWDRYREVFLPEDFRALRIFLWQHLRWARLADDKKPGESLG